MTLKKKPYHDIKKEADLVTRLLCTVMGQLEVADITVAPEATAWYEVHKEKDRQRLQRLEAEKAMKQAAKKALEKEIADKKKALAELEFEMDYLVWTQNKVLSND